MTDSRQLSRQIEDAKERVELLNAVVKRCAAARALVEDDDKERYWGLVLEYEIDLREAHIELLQLEIALRKAWRQEGFEVAEHKLPTPDG